MKQLFYFLSLVLFATTACQYTEEDEDDIQIRHYTSETMAELDLPFSDAVIVDETIYVSGQVGNIPGKLELVEGGMEAETRQALENIKSILEANGSSMENIVKVTVMMDDMSQWSDMNEVYKEYFPGNKPARSALGADGLALGAKLEIECIAVLE